jgi:single-strand DNA-binding protein
MNRIEIIGHIGNDAEIKDFNSNQVINFSVGVSESYTNKEGVKVQSTTWYECAKWGNQTQIAPYLKKGTQIFVSGKPQNRAYVKESDGSLQVVNGINVNQIQLLGSKNDNNASSVTNEPKPRESATEYSNDNPTYARAVNSMADNPEPESDLPF